MERKSKPFPYRGRLNPFQISEGIRGAKNNAKRLFDDANVLSEKGRFPTACSLAVLVIEELGKLPILRRMTIAETDDQWRECWRDFSDHLAKSMSWVVPYLVKNAETPLDLFDIQAKKKDPELLNSLKQLGLYVGCYGRAHWSIPERVIEKDVASVVMSSATILLLGSTESELDTPTALQRWSDHMKGHFFVDALLANNLIVDFLLSARSLGIRLDGEKIPHNVAFEWMSTAIYISSGSNT
jgi:AbiV family abortive infection protein